MGMTVLVAAVIPVICVEMVCYSLLVNPRIVAGRIFVLSAFQHLCVTT